MQTGETKEGQDIDFSSEFVEPMLQENMDWDVC